MELLEWRETVDFINSEIREILRNQRVLNEVHDALGARAERPLEEDFIAADALDRPPNEPVVRVIDDVEITVRVLHRQGESLTDVVGADLLYEIEGRKYVLIQYKTPDRRGLVHHDETQLDELIEACSATCRFRTRSWPRCGAWHCVRGPAGASYHIACEASAIFGTAATRMMDKFKRGLSKEAFDELFAKCWVGARISPSELTYWTWSTFDARRVLFSVLQRGTFGP